jgi:hypothetical protein
VQIYIVANGGCGDNRVLLVLCAELREYVIRLGIDYRMFFNPPNLIFLSLDFEEAAAVLKDFKLLPVGDGRNAV